MRLDWVIHGRLPGKPSPAPVKGGRRENYQAAAIHWCKGPRKRPSIWSGETSEGAGGNCDRTLCTGVVARHERATGSTERPGACRWNQPTIRNCIAPYGDVQLRPSLPTIPPTIPGETPAGRGLRNRPRPVRAMSGEGQSRRSRQRFQIAHRGPPGRGTRLSRACGTGINGDANRTLGLFPGLLRGCCASRTSHAPGVLWSTTRSSMSGYLSGRHLRPSRSSA